MGTLVHHGRVARESVKSRFQLHRRERRPVCACFNHDSGGLLTALALEQVSVDFDLLV
eukprot:CAMPEP_0205908654 /NCGR_PEP_ID=MMETSP1325-20131115/3363_1 /ASSEMBLY_ACC=CAM_ASM_000708 /TAXON_ID=236786 /ORGANISM="Florenciella sp., Strain RCC1007" /LENGTH=57 /DNA_ID=CAMNT_0053274885 /DNA_START=306 /DNA_END=479 /DNA_ORIENTATION=-